jgi:hypothetical protein
VDRSFGTASCIERKNPIIPKPKLPIVNVVRSQASVVRSRANRVLKLAMLVESNAGLARGSMGSEGFSLIKVPSDNYSRVNCVSCDQSGTDYCSIQRESFIVSWVLSIGGEVKSLSQQKHRVPLSERSVLGKHQRT